MYGGVAIGSGSKIVRDTYSTYREKGVALGNKSVVDRRFWHLRLHAPQQYSSDLQTPDSMENDIALLSKQATPMSSKPSMTSTQTMAKIPIINGRS